MPLTTAQRLTAIKLVLINFNNKAVLTQMTGGLTPTAVAEQTCAALGDSVDVVIENVLAWFVSTRTQTLQGLQNEVATIEAIIAANTVTQ